MKNLQKLIFLWILLPCIIASVSALGDNLVHRIESGRDRFVALKSKLVLLNVKGEVVDSLCVSPLEIKDHCTDLENEHIFTILGAVDSLRGSRLAVYSRASRTCGIEMLWLDQNRGYNPWKIRISDVDGDSQPDICVGVWKKTRFHQIFANRLFIYDWNGREIFPKWLGSRLSSPFFDFTFEDINQDGVDELISLELQRNGLNRIMSYKWTGFGFEGFKELARDLDQQELNETEYSKQGD